MSPRKAPTTDQLRNVASIYARAVAEGNPRPIQAITDVTGTSRATAHRWVERARHFGFLPPRPPGGRIDVHEPRRALWANDQPDSSWLACRTCRTPWPCPSGSPQQPKDHSMTDQLTPEEAAERLAQMLPPFVAAVRQAVQQLMPAMRSMAELAAATAAETPEDDDWTPTS